jgi:putative ABC transport system permease protein
MVDDLRYAWRRLRSAPVFAATAMLTLALGIGANTAIFSIADAVLFRPLPYSDPDTLHLLQMRNAATGRRSVLVPYAYLTALDQHHSGVSEVGLVDGGDTLVYTDAAGSSFVPVTRVSANYFDLLGARAARGRLLTAADAREVGRVAVLTYATWQTTFGGSEAIVGRPLTIGTATFDIVGVLARDFIYPSVFGPISASGRPSGVVTLLPARSTVKDGGTFHPIVRRSPGVSRDRAQAEIDALIRPLVSSPTAVELPYLEDIRSVLYPTGRPIMTLLLSASALVLLLGCVNLTNMLLTRARQGEREAGIRLALGAGRLRVVRGLVCEAVLVGLGGAVMALAVTYWSFDLLLRQVPPVAYGAAPVGVDARVLAFGAMLGLTASLMVAAIPAWRATRVGAQQLLQQRSGARPVRFGRSVVAVQVAMAVLLVFGAVVTARALMDVLRVPLGFSSDNVLRLSALPPTGSRGAARQQFYLRIIESLSARADVVSAGAITSVPLSPSAADDAVAIGGERVRSVGLFHVLPGYFETLRIPLRRGRLLDARDASSRAGVAVVSEGAAQILFPDRDPLGASISNGRGRTFVVIGVVGAVRTRFGDDTQPIYVLPGEGARVMSVFVRMRARSDAALTDVKRELSALAPATPIGGRWWSDEIAANTAYRIPRFQTLVLGSFAGLALVLTATGILGVVSFLIAVRTREMGIRIAVGATPASLVGLMLRQTLIPIAIGLVAGLMATRWAARFAEAQLSNVNVHDPATLVAASLAVLLTASLAAYLPARRAGRVDPIAVLRVE